MSKDRLRIEVKRPVAVTGPYNNYKAINSVLRDLDLNHVLTAESIRIAKLNAKSLIFIHSDQGRRLFRRITKTMGLKRLHHLPKLPECPRTTYLVNETDHFEDKFLPAAPVVDMEIDSFNLDELATAIDLPASFSPELSTDFCNFFNEAVGGISEPDFWNEPKPLEPVPSYESLDDILARALAPNEEDPPQLQVSEERQYFKLQPLVEQNYEAGNEAHVEQGWGAPKEAEFHGVTFGDYLDRWHSENALYKVFQEFPPVSPPMETDELGLQWKETVDFFLQ